MSTITVNSDPLSVDSLAYGNIEVERDPNNEFWIRQRSDGTSSDLIHLTLNQVKPLADALLKLKDEADLAAKDRIAVPGLSYRHFKTGDVYQVQAIATEEATGREVVVYKNVATARCWTRPRDEFEDGRFVRHRAFEAIPGTPRPKFGEDLLD